MALKQQVEEIFLEQETVVHRPNQIYTTAIGAYNIFTIVGGPVEILLLGGIETAAVLGETLEVTINGVAADDAAPTAINAAVGGVFFVPLNTAGTIVNAAALPMTVATLTTMVSGILAAANGVIVGTFATGTSWSGEWFCVFRRLSPRSNIIVSP